MTSTQLAERLPRFLRRHLLHFECEIEDAVARFACRAPAGARVLDAGAGECRHARHFVHARYCGVDLAVGDPAWNYRKLDCVCDLAALPVREASFAACLNIVTLEHVPEPARVLAEIHRALIPGGRLLLIAPQDWEVHQAPHDYYRYTRHGLHYLLTRAGFTGIAIQPAGGYFRLVARRLLNGLQFFLKGARLAGLPAAALFLVPPALILPFLDFLDRDRRFTLGYLCQAQKPS